MNVINTNISATTGANAIAHNVRHVLGALTRIFLAPSRNSVSNDATGLSVLKNQIHKTILLLGRGNETEAAVAIKCTRKIKYDSELTNTKKERPRTLIELPEYALKAFEFSRVKITSLMQSTTLANAN